MSIVMRFTRLINEGVYTKTQLISWLDKIQARNSTPLILVTTEEYDEILALINASNLPD